MPSRRRSKNYLDRHGWMFLMGAVFLLSLLSVWRQPSVLCNWFGCTGCNRKRRSPRKCCTCRKLSPRIAGWTKGEASLSGRYQVGAPWHFSVSETRNDEGKKNKKKIKRKSGVRGTQKQDAMIMFHLFETGLPKTNTVNHMFIKKCFHTAV